jgi:hypothetical protein
MFEYVFLMLMCFIVIHYCRNHPIVKHYLANTRERAELAKRHVRLFKARNDLMVSSQTLLNL